MSANNQTFSPHRFGAYLRKDWGENYRRHLLFAAVMFGLMLLVTISYSVLHNYEASELYKEVPEVFSGDDMSAFEASPQTKISAPYAHFHATISTWLAVMFMCSTAFFASTAFFSMASKEWRLRALTIPASQFEKFLSAFLISVVGGWVVSVAGWWLTENLNYWIFSLFTPYGKFFRPDDLGPMFDGTRTTFLIWITFVPIFLQSLFFLGSTVWPRLSFPKTFGAGLLILAAMTFAMRGGFSIMFHKFGSYAGIPSTILTDVHTYIYLSVIMTFVNYAVAYARLRETDVVRKW